MKRSLGFFRKYDYLKTLQVGIKPGTHVFLSSMMKYTHDNLRNITEVNTLIKVFSELAEIPIFEMENKELFARYKL